MKLYFIPIIVFLSSLNSSQKNQNNTQLTVVWINSSIDEEEFNIEDLFYELPMEIDSNVALKRP